MMIVQSMAQIIASQHLIHISQKKKQDIIIKI